MLMEQVCAQRGKLSARKGSEMGVGDQYLNQRVIEPANRQSGGKGLDMRPEFGPGIGRGGRWRSRLGRLPLEGGKPREISSAVSTIRLSFDARISFPGSFVTFDMTEVEAFPSGEVQARLRHAD